MTAQGFSNSDLSYLLVLSQIFHIWILASFQQISLFHSRTLCVSQCTPVIPKWINYIWVKSPAFVKSFEILPLLHQTARKSLVIIMIGFFISLARQTSHKGLEIPLKTPGVSWLKEHNLTNFCRAQ